MSEKEDKRQWYLRTGGTAVFGPISTSGLTLWAEQGRILPGHEVSQDHKKWVLAETVPELAMTAYIDLGNGNLGGPFNKTAAETLLKSGRVPPGSKLLTNVEAGINVQKETDTAKAEQEEEEEPAPKEQPGPHAKDTEADDERVAGFKAEIARQRERIAELEKPSEELAAVVKERDALAAQLKVETEKSASAADTAKKETDLRDAKIKSLEEELSGVKNRLTENEASYAELLKTSNERDMKAQKRLEELEKSCALPPEAIIKFQTDQSAVYGLVKEVTDALSQSLEQERGYMERLKALASERQQTMYDHRRTLLKILGSSPIDMTRLTLREHAYDPQVASLRAQVENQHITAQREKRFADTRETELLQKIRQLESEAAHLRETTADAERKAADVQNLRDLLAQREQELGDERRDRNEEQEQFTASQSALLARIETLEKKINEQGAPDEVVSRR